MLLKRVLYIFISLLLSCGDESGFLNDMSCDSDYHLENGECISNWKKIACENLTVDELPLNSIQIDEMVDVYYIESFGWSSPKKCSWRCDSQYFSDGVKCLSEGIREQCSNILPQNSHYSSPNEDGYIDRVYYEELGVYLPTTDSCSWSCNDDFYRVGEHCVNKTRVVMCENSNPENSVWDDSNLNGYLVQGYNSELDIYEPSENSCQYRCIDGYVKNLDLCFIETKEVNCENILPQNAHWSDSNSNGLLTQNYNIDENIYKPAADSCSWECDDNFIKDIDICVLENRTVNCENRVVEHSHWSSSNPNGVLVQHYNTETDIYEPNESNCAWECDEEYSLKDGVCVKEQIPIFNYLTPKFVMELYPSGEKAGNVIQGFAVDYSSKKIYTTTDMFSTNQDRIDDTLINRLSLQSGITDNCTVWGGEKALGHGQDLSIEKSNGKIYLWTGTASNRGVSRLDISNNSLQTKDIFSSDWTSATPSTSLNNRYIAVRAAKVGDGSQDYISLFNLNDLISSLSTSNTPAVVSRFKLNSAQTVGAQNFQGVAVDDELNIIYAMTGNADVNSPKLLYAYSFNGDVLSHITISIDKTLAEQYNPTDKHYEPEGLSLVKTDSGKKILYFSLIMGNPAERIKRLYAFSENSIYLGGDKAGIYDGGYLALFSSQTGSLEVHQLLKNGKLGCKLITKTFNKTAINFIGYNLNGTRYLLKEELSSGAVTINKIINRVQIFGEQVFQSDWSSGWDVFKLINTVSNSYLFHLKSSDGTVHTNRLTSNGVSTRVQEMDWSNDWNIASVCYKNSIPYLFHLKTTVGTMHINRLTDDGLISTRTDDQVWTTGWSSAECLNFTDNSYLFHYKKSSGLVHINRISNDGKISTRVFDDSIASGYTLSGSVELNGDNYISLFNPTTKKLQTYKLSTTGDTLTSTQSKTFSTAFDSMAIFK
ncbi:hypothetical protein JXR93_08340 [bacterium]|nr:hypothetical protein [bacterium]